MKRTCSVILILMTLIAAVMVLPAYGGEQDRPWTIYFNPGVRFGTDNRTLYIMDFLVPLYQGDKNILFFNPRFTPNDIKGWEVNLGFGYRQLLLDDKLILGANFYYDRRHTGWGTSHEQIGFGLEAMTEVNPNLALTARFNYYIPMSDAIVADGILGTSLGHYLMDDGIYERFDDATLTRTVEEPLEGFDAELGIRVPYVSNYLETWVYAGGYHYWGDYIKNVNGVTARLELVPTDFVRLAYEYRYDNISHGNHYGEVMFEVPFSIENLVAGKNPFEGFGKRLSGSRELSERLVEPVRRDVDVNVKTKTARNFVGNGYNYLRNGIIFVSNLGDDVNGNGTKSHPYRTIDMAISRLPGYPIANTIHVMNEDPGLTFDNFYFDGSNTTIWGSGALNPKYPDLHGYTLTSPPVIEGSCNLWHPTNVTISGFEFRGGGNGGYWKSGIMFMGGQDGLVIRDNWFDYSGASNESTVVGIWGQYLQFGGAPLVIKNNTFVMTTTYTGTDQPNGCFGIFLTGGDNVGNYPVILADITSNTFNITSASETAYTFAAYAADIVDYSETAFFPGNGYIGDRSSSRPFVFSANSGSINHASTFAGHAGMLYLVPGVPGGITGPSPVPEPVLNPYVGNSYVDLGVGASGIGSNTINASGFFDCNYGGIYDSRRNPALYVNP